MKRKLFKALSIATTLAVIALVGTYFMMDIVAGEKTMQFDKALWKSAWQTPAAGQAGSSAQEKYPRKAMLGDLLNGELLKPGVGKSAVIELLGSGESFHDGQVLSYLIGPSDWSVDFNKLIIEFDDNDQLIKHYLWAYDSPPPHPSESDATPARAKAKR